MLKSICNIYCNLDAHHEIFLDKNYGYAKGNNYGLRLAHRLGYKYSLISNNDVKIIDKNVLVELIKGIETSNENICASPKVIEPNDHVFDPIYKEPKFLNFAVKEGILYPFFRLTRQKINKSITTETIKPFFGFFLVRNYFLDKIDFFDEGTFLFVEEDIFLFKIKSLNLRSIYVPTVKIFHYHGQTTKGVNSTKIHLIITKSYIYYFNKYRGYSKLSCKMALLSKYIYIFFYRPIVKFFILFGNKKKAKNLSL